jgi:hypothetical protein
MNAREDSQSCVRCDDEVYALSSRGWCDGCEAEVECEAVEHA